MKYLLHESKLLLDLYKRNNKAMKKYKSYKDNIPDRELNNDFNEDVNECFSCGLTAELDVHGRCYSCGLEDAQEFTREND